MIRSLLLLLLTASIPAQVVKVANHSPMAFNGWKRCTVDRKPPVLSGSVAGASFVVGRRVGLDTWAVDLRLSLEPFESRAFDLATATATAMPAVNLPADPIGFFGGWVSVLGSPLLLDQLAADGAAVTAHAHARVTSMLHVDLWATWYPDEPGLITGEAVVCCSNGSLVAMGGDVGPEGLRLTWGDGLVHVVGAGWGAPLVPPLTNFGDGQARAVPFVIVWPRLFQTISHWTQGMAAVNLSMCAVGISKLWPSGNPVYPIAFNATSWTTQRFGASLERLHSWEAPVVGPTPNSGVTGGQEDEVFVRGEALLPGGVGAEVVAYLNALKLAGRPCHHLEADGRPADPDLHPDCVFWSGRPHYHPAVSPDKLGKPRSLTIEEAHGWNGPDREHWLYNTVYAANRLVDSKALQWILAQQARVYLFSETVKPGWSTSGTDAARSVGWACILAMQLHYGMEDRVLEQRMLTRFQDRCRLIYLPLHGSAPNDITDIRIDDARLGPGAWWMPWQQGVEAAGLDLAGEALQMPAVRALGVRLAQRVLQDAWVKVGNRWMSKAQAAVDGSAGTVNESFNYFGNGLAPAVVLRNNPTDERALAIWTQLRSEATDTGEASWLIPGGF